MKKIKVLIKRIENEEFKEIELDFSSLETSIEDLITISLNEETHIKIISEEKEFSTNEKIISYLSSFEGKVEYINTLFDLHIIWDTKNIQKPLIIRKGECEFHDSYIKGDNYLLIGTIAKIMFDGGEFSLDYVNENKKYFVRKIYDTTEYFNNDIMIRVINDELFFYPKKQKNV